MISKVVWTRLSLERDNSPSVENWFLKVLRVIGHRLGCFVTNSEVVEAIVSGKTDNSVSAIGVHDVYGIPRVQVRVQSSHERDRALEERGDHLGAASQCRSAWRITQRLLVKMKAEAEQSVVNVDHASFVNMAQMRWQ